MKIRIPFLLIPAVMFSLTRGAHAEADAGETHASAKAELVEHTRIKAGKEATTTYHLTINVKLTDGAAAKAFAMGSPKAEPVIVGGKEVKIDDVLSAKWGYMTIDRSLRPFLSGHPENGMGFEIPYGAIPKETKKIDLVKGSITALVGGTPKEVLLKNLLTHPKGTIVHPALKAAGLALKFQRQMLDGDIYITIQTKADTIGFVGIEFIGADGKRIDGKISGSFGRKQNVYSISSNKTELKGASIKLLFRNGAKVVELPFEVKDVICYRNGVKVGK